MCVISLIYESLDSVCDPRQVDEVLMKSLFREEMVICRSDRCNVIYPFSFYIFHCEHFSPGMVDESIVKRDN